MYTCLIVRGDRRSPATCVNYSSLNGFFKVATFLAITVPCATVIMVVDHFLLRAVRDLPAADECPALGGDVGSRTGRRSLRCSSRGLRRDREHDPAERLERLRHRPELGPRTAGVRLIAGGLYLVIVTATQSMTNARTWLGFPHTSMTRTSTGTP